ncbi:MAG: SMC family ATPase [Oscillospiraceae bacterium]|nr:SMC family ATPase [Oscillospiraceae bacterium]
MRPIKLVMSAFCSYPGVEELDMEQLGTKGLYLITGAAGAGKTVIFDAITYALYGKPSGKNRNDSELRSFYADPDTPTFVELTFSYAGKTYKVKRGPAYERPTNKGSGTTKKSAFALLEFSDGRPALEDIKKVNEAIENIIGVDKDQFSQIVMIAQGDFLQVIHADTKQRGKILRKIFRTKPYNDLQDRISAELSVVSKSKQDIKQRIGTHIKSILCGSDGELADRINEIKSIDEKELAIENIEEAVSAAKALTEQDKAVHDANEEELQKLGSEIKNITVLISETNKIIETKNAILTAEQKKDGLIPKLEQFKNALNAEKEKQPETDELSKQVSAIEAELPMYDKLEGYLSVTTDLNTLIDNNTETLKTKQDEKKTLQDELNGYEKELDELKGTGEKLIQLNADKEALVNRQTDIKKLNVSIAELKEKYDQLEKAQTAYTEASQKAERLSLEYSAKLKAFRDAQAGIMAEELSEDDPCPVCGSTVHPHKAVKPAETPSEEEVNEAKEKAELADEDAGEKSKDSGILEGQISNEEKNILNQIKYLIGDIDIKDAKKKIPDIFAKISDDLEKLEASVSKEKENAERKTLLEELIPPKKEKFAGVDDEIFILEKNIAANTAALEANDKQCSDLAKNLKYKNKTEAETEMNKKISEIESHKTALKTAEDSFDECQTELTRLDASITELCNLLDDPGEDISIQALTDQLTKLTSRRNELTDRQTELTSRQKELTEMQKPIYNRMETNKTASENIRTELEKYKETEKKYVWISDLSDTAGGKLNEQDKVTFETYIQTAYFERIIRYANKRLLEITDGHYEFKRREKAMNKRSQSGLELNVIDHYNGSERSVASLSGGEGFKASLSLALGLSDEIQASAGGIQLDTLFLDEGFGTLEGNDLDQVMKVLNDLTDGNRLVGIISHVDALKKSIDKQIVVTNVPYEGSTAKIVV